MQDRADGTGDRAGRARPLRALVADDDRLIGELIAELLGSLGHDVCAVETTEAGAIAAAGRCKPDLMILDVNLGAGSGVLVMREVLKSQTVAVVLISGAPHDCEGAGPRTLLKPFRAADLVSAVEAATAAVQGGAGP